MTDQTQAAQEARAREELLPCPFCGAAAYPGNTTYSRPLDDATWADGSPVLKTYRINCGSCGGTAGGGVIGGQQTPEKAINAWNRRHRETHDASSGGEPWPGYTADLDRRRVVTLAKVGLMLSIMAGGEAPEVTGFDAGDLYAEVLMALAIEDSEDPDIALEIARVEPDSHLLSPTSEAATADVLSEGALEALDAALEQYSAPMSALNGHELGERLASDVYEIVRHARARAALKDTSHG